MTKRSPKMAGTVLQGAEAPSSTRSARVEMQDPFADRNHPGNSPEGLAHWRDLAMAAFIGSQAGPLHQNDGSGGPQQWRLPQGLSDPDWAGIFAYAGVAAGWANAIDILRCRVVLRLVTELFEVALERELADGVARRRPGCHMRQIAMYLSHVVLSVPYRTIARAFGRDRSTVVHACAVVEDWRDDLGYDKFVERCERCVNAVFAPFGACHEER